MQYKRMPIEIESPEQMGYDNIRYNLTESSMDDIAWDALDISLKSLFISYGDHIGKPELRELIISDLKYPTTEKNPIFNINDVLITQSAAAALFIIHTSLLEKDDHIVVVYPNYATNIETPRAIGCAIDYMELKMEQGFELDIDKIEAMIQPNTRLISLTTPHNPTGKMLTEPVLRGLIGIVEKHGIYLLVDETYRELAFITPPPVAATMSHRVISVTSMSKAYGLPGIRIGWILCQNPALMEMFLAAKEQIFITNSIVDEEIAFQFLKNKNHFFPAIQAKARLHLDILKDWLGQQKYLDSVLPEGGVVCFPRMKEIVDVDTFYTLLNNKYETYVGPGHWFEMDKRYFRIGFGWPTTEDLTIGLSNISKALEEAVIR
jgi:aspartate/methionine/tyrosine aminotransferase